MKLKNKKKILIPLAVATMTIGASMTSFAAYGWQNADGTWHYYDSDGNLATESWKKSGNNWYWLDENGDMATDTLVEVDDEHYYVDENGVQVKNQWRELDNDDDSEDASDTAWYYFGPNGKAYKAGDSGKTTFKSIVTASGATKKYAFDDQGRMLYGWVNESSERQTGDDAWKEGVYYLGDAGDGALRDNQWAKIDVVDDEQEDDDFQDYYWFYFKSNGKKTVDTTKKINGKKYRFTENGNAIFNWYATPSEATPASASNMFYSQPSDSWLSIGWFYTVPGENVDSEAHDADEAHWFYADKDGDLTVSQIKKINGSYYGFDEHGEMLDGLYKLSVDGRTIVSYEEIESESDLPEADEAWDVYYFGGSSKEGALKTGTASITLDGETYKYSFKKSGDERGKGIDGFDDGYLYIKGQLQKADSDEKLKVVTYEDEDYLVNTSGKVQKSKKNIKDADDYYYCTDSNGVVTYKDSEKWKADADK